MSKALKPKYKMGTLVKLNNGYFLVIVSIVLYADGSFAYQGEGVNEEELIKFGDDEISEAYRKINSRKKRVSKAGSKKKATSKKAPSKSAANAKAKKEAALKKVNSKNKGIEPMFPGQYDNSENQNELPM
jgi:hypothetical protein